MKREPLFSVTANDVEFQHFRCGGNGGQKQNKTSSGARCIHKPSGAIGESREERSQWQNKKAAFKRMANSLAFRRWVYQRVQEIDMKKTLEQWADEQISPQNIQLEIKKDGKWTVVNEKELED